jgi:5-methyltetrahydrofolate--homocysteine methyltransferase
VPGIDEAATLDSVVQSVQSVVTAPLQIDTSDPAALERALRHVNGKALVNSVNGKRESMDCVFPLVSRYGGTMVALCLDEDGIPATADGRLAVARKILAEGRRYGFAEKDFVFDALTLAVSADPTAASVTIETVRRLTDELKVNTVLGVSNVSFGLPDRPSLNNAMYTLACRAGLSAAIANPSAIAASGDEAAFDVLTGRDPNCARWIESRAAVPTARPAVATEKSADPLSEMILCVKRGLKADAGAAAASLLAAGAEPMKVVQEGIVPALEEVGRGFEAGSVFLPQLLMAADAAGAAFEAVKAALGGGTGGGVSKGRPVVLATVKGDIHDIGKNIVRALLENYGFNVIDLGRDVSPEEVVAAAEKSGAMLVGLSALMTTTVGAMAETVALVKARLPDCRTCVGGAVVTAEYAKSIGADFYAKDAMRTVRIAEALENGIMC